MSATPGRDRSWKRSVARIGYDDVAAFTYALRKLERRIEADKHSDQDLIDAAELRAALAKAKAKR